MPETVIACCNSELINIFSFYQSHPLISVFTKFRNHENDTFKFLCRNGISMNYTEDILLVLLDSQYSWNWLIGRFIKYLPIMVFRFVNDHYLLELLFFPWLEEIDLNNIRISRPEVFCKKDVLKSFSKLTVKHVCQSIFFNKVLKVLSLHLY